MCIIITALNILTSGKLVVKVVKGALLLKKAKTNNQMVIKCTSTVYKLRNYFISVVLDLAVLVFIIRLFSLIKYSSLIGVVIIITTFCSELIELIIHIIAIFREKYGYLTSDGLIYFIGCFKFDNCRFVWDSTANPDILSDTLHVYRQNEKMPFTVIFYDQIEEAHQIVSINQFYF